MNVIHKNPIYKTKPGNGKLIPMRLLIQTINKTPMDDVIQAIRYLNKLSRDNNLSNPLWFIPLMINNAISLFLLYR